MTQTPLPSLLDPETLECPFPLYHTLHREAPVYRMPETGFYVVTRYDLVMAAARNFKVFGHDANQRANRPGGPNLEAERVFAEQGWPQVATMTQCDPPRYDRYRPLVDRAFTASRVRAMEDYIETIVQDLLDAFIDKGEVEFVQEFAVKLPIFVIADQLGVPRADLARFKRWSDASVEPIGLLITREREVECAREVVEFQHYFAAKLEEKRAKPTDDIISTLATAEFVDDDGVTRPLNTAEFLSIVQQLLVAGNETTTNALGAGLVLLIERPDQIERLRREPFRLKTFVEEVLRLSSPVAGLFRRTTADTTLGDTFVPKGSMVLLRWAAANRDETVFDDADTLDVCRKNAGAHIAFGVGTHFCVGAMLARQELFQSFRAIIERMDSIRLKPGHVLRHHPNLILRGLTALPITFHARSMAAS